MASKINKKLFIPLFIGLVVLIIGIVLVLVIFPNVIENEVIENVELKDGTLQWYRFKEIPFPFTFAVTLFAIDNKEEALTGAKPIAKEVGPFVYYETKLKEIIGMDKSEVTYNDVWTFKFNPNASRGLTEEDTVTVVNAPVMAIMQTLEDLPISLGIDVNTLLGQIFDQTDIFIDVKVGDWTFNGIPMCHKTNQGGYAKLICLAIMLMNQKLLEYQPDGSMLFSLFKYKTKPDGPFTLQRGLDDPSKLGSITSYKGKQYTNYWNGTDSECDKVEGFYTTFPPFMEEDTSFRVYSTDICKTAILNFKEETTYKDISTYRFETNEESFASSTNECVCIEATKGLDGKTHCYREGVVDMNTCMGVPVILSFPHLMGAGKAYQDSVGGLSSGFNESHNTIIEFEPRLGYPLHGNIRLQFNIVLRPVKFGGTDNALTKDLNRSLFPILWLDEYFELSDDLLDEMDSKLFDMLVLAEAVQWTLVAVGAFLIVLSIILILCCRKK